MVNTRTDADLSAAVQNALRTLLPQIRAEIHEEFRTSSGPSDAAPVDAENWISYMEKIFDVMGCEDAFKTRLVVYKFEGMHLLGGKPISKPRVERLKREYHSIRQTNTETSTEFMQRFLRLDGSTLNHLMCMSYTDVAQVANAARNYEILHERDDDNTERPDKRSFGNGRDQRNRGQQSNRYANS
nr:hypothetical protein [Tanacetum cinerariifolium]